MYSKRLQSDLAALSLQVVAGSAILSNGGGGGGSAAQGLLIGQQLLWQLRQTKPVGRLVINVEGAYRGPTGGPYDVLLKDGDKLVVPKRTQDVTILGEVQSPTSHVFAQGLTRDDYIAEERRNHAARGSKAHLRSARERGCRVGLSVRLVQALPGNRYPPRRFHRRADGHTEGSVAAACRRHHDHHLQSSDRLYSGPRVFVTGWRERHLIGLTCICDCRPYSGATRRSPSALSTGARGSQWTKIPPGARLPYFERRSDGRHQRPALPIAPARGIALRAILGKRRRKRRLERPLRTGVILPETFRRYGADPTGKINSSTAWANAIAGNDHVFDGSPGGRHLPLRLGSCRRFRDTRCRFAAPSRASAGGTGGTRIVLSSTAGSGKAIFHSDRSFATGILIERLEFDWQSYSANQIGFHASGDLRASSRTSIVPS